MGGCLSALNLMLVGLFLVMTKVGVPVMVPLAAWVMIFMAGTFVSKEVPKYDNKKGIRKQ